MRESCLGVRIVIHIIFLLALGNVALNAATQSSLAGGRWQGYLDVPKISEISPTSMKVAWAPYDKFDATTHYQVRIDHALYGASLTGSDVTVYHLKPARTYRIEVITYHQGSMIGISSPTSVLMGPAAPETLFTSDITTSTFVLHWTSAPTATGYHVIDSSGKILATLAASANSATLTGFSPGQTVTVRVVSENPSSVSQPSKPVTVVLKPRPPDLTVAVDQIASTSFLVTWNLVEGAASYTVFVGTSPFAIVASSVSSLRVEGQEPGASLTVKILAENASGQSEYSPAVSVQLKPGDPERPWVTSLSSATFVLNWKLVNGAESYQVFNDKAWHLANIPAPTTSTLVKGGFNPGEVARITLVARNKTGDSGHSLPVIVTFPSSTASGSVTEPITLMRDQAAVSLTTGAPVPDIWLEDADSQRFSLGSIPRTELLVLTIWKCPADDRLPRLRDSLRALSLERDLRAIRFIDILVSSMPITPGRLSPISSRAQVYRLAPPEPAAFTDLSGDAPLCLLVSPDGTLKRVYRPASAAQMRIELQAGVSAFREEARIRMERSRFDGLHQLRR